MFFLYFCYKFILDTQLKKIVITGGPSTGKTSVINLLENSGYLCLHEVIRDMTAKEQETDQEITFKSNPIVSVDDPMAFNQRILDARVTQYQLAETKQDAILFFDRGIPDVLAYMDCFEQQYPQSFIDACTNHLYDHVFLMPPWKEIHVSDSQRFESYEEALLIDKCLSNTYAQLGYEVIIVPKDTIQKRVEFILNTIKELI